MSTEPATMFLASYTAEITRYRQLAERALAQVDDAGFFRGDGDRANPLAITVKHLGGNLRSRFREFLTTDGEKPDRDRDSEFVLTEADTRASLEDRWKTGWDLFFEAVAELGPKDLERTITIRGEGHTVVAALHRALAHVAYHAGQIVHQARQEVGSSWRSLSVPKGGTVAFNQGMAERFGDFTKG